MITTERLVLIIIAVLTLVFFPTALLTRMVIRRIRARRAMADSIVNHLREQGIEVEVQS